MQVELLTFEKAHELFPKVVNKYLEKCPLPVNERTNKFIVIEAHSKDLPVTINSIVQLITGSRVIAVLLDVWSSISDDLVENVTTQYKELFEENHYTPIDITDTDYKECRLFGILHPGLIF